MISRVYEVVDLRCWMILRWPGIVTLTSLPNWVKLILNNAFPPATTEGVEIELVRCITDFGMNSIPTCQVSLAVGRDMSNPLNVAVSHLLSSELKLFLPASVYVSGMSPSSEGTNRTVWPINEDGTPKSFRIFDGYIVGPTFSGSSQSADISLSLVHWLADMDFSSALSRSSSPLAPTEFSFDPICTLRNSAGGFDRNGTKISQFADYFTSAMVTDDLWGNIGSAPVLIGDIPNQTLEARGGIKRVFTDLCSEDRINVNQYRPGQLNTTGSCGQVPSRIISKNVEALAAIKRFEPFFNDAGKQKYIDGVPLSMDIDRTGVDSISRMIAHLFGTQTMQQVGATTLWQTLLFYASQLQLSVVPLVEKALVVPFNPGLRSEWAFIDSDDYDAIDMSSENVRPLRGMAFFANKAYGAGGFGINVNTLGAFYENPDRRHGLIMFSRLPDWLSDVIIGEVYGIGSQPLSDARTVAPGGAALVDRPKPPDQALSEVRSIWCDYARAAYIQEVLRNRSIRISGKVRFDICPGSIVRLERPVEKFVKARLDQITTDYGSDDYTAQVVRVSMVIDSEACQAGSILQLAFHRCEAENSNDSYSTLKHPIWSKNWFGAPMVSLPEFYPPTEFDLT